MTTAKPVSREQAQFFAALQNLVVEHQNKVDVVAMMAVMANFTGRIACVAEIQQGIHGFDLMASIVANAHQGFDEQQKAIEEVLMAEKGTRN